MPIIDVDFGDDVVVSHPDLVNLYGCAIGSGTRIGPFVEIQRGSRIGRRCRISSHSFICEGVVLEDEVMIAHGVMFTNDRMPRAVRPGGSREAQAWAQEATVVRRGASIGSNATIGCGVEIGPFAVVSCGAVVMRDVPARAVVAGVPACVIGHAGANATAPRLFETVLGETS